MLLERFGLDRLGNLLLGRALYAWVRTRVAPDRIATLGVDPSKPLCYVAQDRRLSNLLVIEEEVRRAGLPSALGPMPQPVPREKRSVFFVGRARNPFAPARKRYAHSPRLARLVRAVMDNPAFDVQLLPVTILWGRAPGTQDSLLKAYFAEAWETAGVLRQLVTILLHGRQTSVTFAPAMSLRALIAGADNEALALRKASRLLRAHFRREREAAIGPDLSHRRTQIEAILAAAPVKTAIADEAPARDIPLREAEKRARRFAWEIASDFSYPAVRAFELFLKRLWTRLYDGVDVHHFDEVARVAPGHGIVYLPCHRSHIDYLLLSYVINERGLAPPYVAAGANLNFPVVGPLLRRGGAFFLRRSFKGEPLYAAVFMEYLHMMLVKGFPVEYFIEGGRSRTGRTLPPKAGLLGMTVESHLRDHTRPLILAPVYIGYEKLLEGRSFVAELEGEPKQRESLGALIGAARQLKRDFGKVHANFGVPLPLDGYLDAEAAGWRDAQPDQRTELARRVTRPLAHELACRINAAAVINPINLLSMAILGAPRNALDRRVLVRQVELFKTLAARVPYSPRTVVADLDGGAVIARAEKLGMVINIAHPLGDIVKVPDDRVALLTYFRNNTLHAFALPALAACLLTGSRQLTAAELVEFTVGMLPFLRAELFLHHGAADAERDVHRLAEVFVELNLARAAGDGFLRPPDPNSTEAYRLELLARSLRQLLERQYLIVALLTRCGPGRLTRKRLEELVQLLSQRLALLFEFATPDFYDRSAFGSSIAMLFESGLVAEDAAGKLSFDERIRAPAAQVERLLPVDALQAIQRITVGELEPEAGD